MGTNVAAFIAWANDRISQREPGDRRYRDPIGESAGDGAAERREPVGVAVRVLPLHYTKESDFRSERSGGGDPVPLGGDAPGEGGNGETYEMLKVPVVRGTR